MKKNKIIIVCITILVSVALISFKPHIQAKAYQHLFIYTTHYDFDKVFVSIDGKEYKELKFTMQIKGPWDFNPIINLIHQYENEGWELIECTAGSSDSFIRLRKERE